MQRILLLLAIVLGAGALPFTRSRAQDVASASSPKPCRSIPRGDSLPCTPVPLAVSLEVDGPEARDFWSVLRWAGTFVGVDVQAVADDALPAGVIAHVVAHRTADNQWRISTRLTTRDAPHERCAQSGAASAAVQQPYVVGALLAHAAQRLFVCALAEAERM